MSGAIDELSSTSKLNLPSKSLPSKLIPSSVEHRADSRHTLAVKLAACVHYSLDCGQLREPNLIISSDSLIATR